MQALGAVSEGVFGFELGGHECPVVEEEVIPESSTQEIFIHIVLGHLKHSSLDIYIKVGPSSRIACLLCIVSATQVGSQPVQISSHHCRTLSVSEIEGKDIADALGALVAESQVRFDGVGESWIGRHNIQEL